MNDEEQFLIIAEDNGSFLRVYIPGKLPGPWPIRQIKWTGKEKVPSFDDFRREAAQIFPVLKKKGLTKDLPKRIIPGYSHSYAYDFHPMAIYEITPDPKDQVYMRNDVAYNMKHMLWFPLLFLMKEKIKTYDYIQLDLPVLPPVVTEEMCQAWYDNNQKASRFFERISQTSKDTRVERIDTDQDITLKLSHHPFVGQAIRRLPVFPKPKTRAIRLSEDQLHSLHLWVLNRDSNLLKGLSNSERKQLRKGTNPNLTDSYPIHWIRWLSLSGDMTGQNAIVVSADIEKTYQFSVRYPLEQYLRRNGSALAKIGKPVFAEVPIPTNEYRSKPISRVLTPRQNRRQLDNMTRRAVQEYFSEKEYD